jgi:hypothetical protein
MKLKEKVRRAWSGLVWLRIWGERWAVVNKVMNPSVSIECGEFFD